MRKEKEIAKNHLLEAAIHLKQTGFTSYVEFENKAEILDEFRVAVYQFIMTLIEDYEVKSYLSMLARRGRDAENAFYEKVHNLIFEEKVREKGYYIDNLLSVEPEALPGYLKKVMVNYLRSEKRQSEQKGHSPSVPIDEAFVVPTIDHYSGYDDELAEFIVMLSQVNPAVFICIGLALGRGFSKNKELAEKQKLSAYDLYYDAVDEFIRYKYFKEAPLPPDNLSQILSKQTCAADWGQAKAKAKQLYSKHFNR